MRWLAIDIQITYGVADKVKVSNSAINQYIWLLWNKYYMKSTVFATLAGLGLTNSLDKGDFYRNQAGSNL